MSYSYDVIKGNEITGEQMRLSRSLSILNAVRLRADTILMSCRIRSDGAEVVIFKIDRIGVPDEPAFDIHDSEDVAVICTKEDMEAPMVFALREDFPTGLPHSNAQAYRHPVSLCVSDVPFGDYRLQFSGVDYLSYIKRWFYLNSLNRLHEKGRPLEVFFAIKKVCMPKGIPRGNSQYVRLEKVTELSYTADYVEKKEATHFLVCVEMSKEVSSNFIAMPMIVGDLRDYKDYLGRPLLESVVMSLLRTSPLNSLKILICLYVKQQKKESNTDVRSDLFFISINSAVYEVRKKNEELSSSEFWIWFYSMPIDILFFILPTHIDINADSNGLKNQINKIVFIGGGTLGSNVLDALTREGFSKTVAIVDYDLLLPHNIARHILPVHSVMKYKASAIKDYLDGIEGQKIIAVNENYLKLSKPSLNHVFENANLIVDASTSLTVERKLAFDTSIGNMRRCTLFLNPKGTDLVFMMEDENRRQRLDLLEMSYLRSLIVQDDLENHLDVADLQPVNDFSCRAESLKLDYDNVRMLAAVASQQLKLKCFEKQGSVGVWRVDPVCSSVRNIQIKMQNWKKFNISQLDVYIAGDVICEIEMNKEQYKINETGGSLFGCYDKDRRIMYVIFMYSAPCDSISLPNSFIRGSEGQTEIGSKINIRTFHQVRYLGEWHTHPNCSSRPSDLDSKQFGVMSYELAQEDLPFVQIISGNDGLFVNAIM